MLTLFPGQDWRGGRILFLGAHSDDIEIGCGGVAAQIARRGDVSILWVTLSATEIRAAETRNAASRILAGASAVTVRVERFRESYFPSIASELKDYFESLKSFRPDLIFTHYRRDLHQDHRVVNELTWNTFRDHLILEYEIPKYDGDLSTPNAFAPLARDELEGKIAVLMECFPSQRSRTWFTDETFRALARIRGIECAAPEGFAEAFYARKLRIRFQT